MVNNKTGAYGRFFVFFCKWKISLIQIRTTPQVKKASAIEIPDAKLQSAIKVFVIADYFDEEGMRREILDTCRKYLIRWAVPKEIEFRKELPLTKLSKVDYRALQEEENKKYQN